MVSSLVQLVTQIMNHRMIQSVMKIDLKMLRITQNDPHGSRDSNNGQANLKCIIIGANKEKMLAPAILLRFFIFRNRLRFIKVQVLKHGHPESGRGWTQGRAIILSWVLKFK